TAAGIHAVVMAVAGQRRVTRTVLQCVHLSGDRLHGFAAGLRGRRLWAWRIGQGAQWSNVDRWHGSGSSCAGSNSPASMPHTYIETQLPAAIRHFKTAIRHDTHR